MKTLQTSTPRPRISLALVSLTLLPWALISCRVTSHSVTQTQQTQAYERLEIIYRAHPSAGTVFSHVPQGSVVQAAATIPADSTPLSWSKTELRIECPHPNGRTDLARVTLYFRPVECGHECEHMSWVKRMEERAGLRQSRRSTFRERWFYESSPTCCLGETYAEMDLSKSELDSILEELNSHGFFAENGRNSDSESQLEVRLNRRWTSKCWNYEPHLDALTQRVYECGIQRTAIPQE